MRTILNLLMLSVAGLMLTACPRQERQVVYTDLSEHAGISDSLPARPDSPVLRVAIATVISPRESFVYYRDLFDYLSEKLGYSIEFRQRNTYEELNELLAQNQIDVAFVCAGAYIEGSDYAELLVVPEINGLTYYQAYVIANDQSSILRFQDFYGKRFTYADPMCYTGKLYIDNKLRDMGQDAETFFSEILYSYSHDVSIQMVSRNLVDGASVNGLIFEYLEVFQPAFVSNVRIIEKSPHMGIPPIVNSLMMPRDLRNEIQDILTGMHLDLRGKAILNHLLIDRFLIAGDTLYDGLRRARYQ